MAELKKQKLKVSVVRGFRSYRLTRVFQVTTSSRAVGPVAVVNNFGLPTIGSSVIVDGVRLWCVDVDPDQPEAPDTTTHWIVTCVFTNDTSQFQRDSEGNPIETPDQAAKEVNISYIETMEPVNDAFLRSITIGGPEWSEDSLELARPSWLPNNFAGTPTNSAGQAVLIERPTYQEVISVTQVFRNWDNRWSEFNGAINTDEVTIIEKDAEGTRLTKTYAANTLRMGAIGKQNVWKDGRLYFKAKFPMTYEPTTWIHAEPDRGTQRRISTDQFKPDGTKYTQEDLDEREISGDFGYDSIVTNGGDIAIGEPVKFNGTGAEMPLRRTDEASYDNSKLVFLNYDIGPRKAFNDLPIFSTVEP